MVVSNLRRRSTLLMLVAMLLVLNSPKVWAQSEIKGKVVTSAGAVLTGVNVFKKGDTKLATTTNNNGLFSLPAGKGSVLIFSFTGYQNLEVNADSGFLQVEMKEATQMLNDVLVIGYGNMNRRDVTSSVTSIKAKDLNPGVMNSPAQLLQGKVPGLLVSSNNSDPNSTPAVTLRGSSTLRSGDAMEPYYVIDGVPGASLSLIAPDDIVSVDVLRDASATAIYGSKASNGVIMVTTKRGKNGQASISYSGYVAMDKVAKHMKLMDAAQYKSFVLNNGFSLDPYDDQGANTNWQKEVERTGISNNHNVSITGGSGKTQYAASMNYFKNQGVIKGTDLERYIGRASLQTSAINDKLTLAFDVNVSSSKQNDVPRGGQGLSVLDAMYYYLPISPVKRPNGDWFEYPQRSQYANPVSLIDESTILSKIKLIQAHARAGVQIMSGLKYNLDLSLQNRQYNYADYFSTKSMVAAGMNGKSTRAAAEDGRTVMEMNLAYDKTFAGAHKLSALAGYSWEENNNNDGFQLSTYNYYSDNLQYYNPGVANNIDQNALGNYYLSTLRMISFYARLNYSFNSKYLLQATVRRDGSSAFGINNRWATFPSLSLAWRASDEQFIKNLNVFDDLKFRAGYGVSGNSLGFDVFTATQVYGTTGWFVNSAGNQVRTLGATRNANPNLKWENTSMVNLGVDFAFFKGRLSGSVEYYNKITKDLIYDYPVSTTQYLFSWLTTNVGEIGNKGVEVSLNAIPVQKKNFSWNTGINVSHNKNVVRKISNSQFSVKYLDMADLDGAGQSNARQQRIMEGSPIGHFYTWEWAGYNNDGVSQFYVRDAATKERTGATTTTPQDKDRTATGSAQPKFILGWNNSFAYKNLSVSAMFQGVFGNKIMNGTRARYSNVVGNAGNKNLLSSVLETERVTDYNAHYLSDRYLENGSYLRMSSLTVAYDFRHFKNNIARNIRVYTTVNNAFVLTGYKGLDPEVYLGGLTPGIDNRQTYPRSRTFILGLNVNF